MHSFGPAVCTRWSSSGAASCRTCPLKGSATGTGAGGASTGAAVIMDGAAWQRTTMITRDFGEVAGRKAVGEEVEQGNA